MLSSKQKCFQAGTKSVLRKALELLQEHFVEVIQKHFLGIGMILFYENVPECMFQVQLPTRVSSTEKLCNHFMIVARSAFSTAYLTPGLIEILRFFCFTRCEINPVSYVNSVFHFPGAFVLSRLTPPTPFPRRHTATMAFLSKSL